MTPAPCPCPCCEKRRERVRAWGKGRAGRGLCRLCNRAVLPERTHCRKHATRNRKLSKQVRAQRQAEGRCPDCGRDFQPTEGTLRCERCRAMSRRRHGLYMKRRRARSREAA